MSQLPYHAVIVDLDRTLLRTDKTISEYTQGVLREWRQAGAYLFAATARPERAIADYRRIISFHAVTTLNGARTLTPEHAYENAIETEDALFILNQLCETKDMVISVEAENGIYANQDIPVWHPTVTDDIREIPKKEKIYKKTVASKKDIKIANDRYCFRKKRKWENKQEELYREYVKTFGESEQIKKLFETPLTASQISFFVGEIRAYNKCFKG